MKSRFKEGLGSRVRGWIPSEPKLSGKYLPRGGDKKTNIFNTPLNELSFDKILSWVVGFLLVAVGIVTVFNVAGALVLLQVLSVFTPMVSLLGYAFGFWIGILGVVLVGVLVATHVITKASLRKQLTPRRLVPYGAAASLVFLTYITNNLGIAFAYAIPITLIVSGVLVIWGLNASPSPSLPSRCSWSACCSSAPPSPGYPP